MIRKILAGIIVTSLLILPVLASDSGEVDSSAEVQTVEGQEDASIESNGYQDPESSSDLSEVISNQKTINDNIAFVAACIVSTGGLLVGYWTGKDLLDFLW